MQSTLRELVRVVITVQCGFHVILPLNVYCSIVTLMAYIVVRQQSIFVEYYMSFWQTYNVNVFANHAYVPQTGENVSPSLI